jgi:hypothetical protein
MSNTSLKGKDKNGKKGGQSLSNSQSEPTLSSITFRGRELFAHLLRGERKGQQRHGLGIINLRGAVLVLSFVHRGTNNVSPTLRP